MKKWSRIMAERITERLLNLEQFYEKKSIFFTLCRKKGNLACWDHAIQSLDFHWEEDNLDKTSTLENLDSQNARYLETAMRTSEWVSRCIHIIYVYIRTYLYLYIHWKLEIRWRRYYNPTINISNNLRRDCSVYIIIFKPLLIELQFL